MKIEERLKEVLEENKRFFMFWKWSATEWREIKALVLILLLGLYLGMHVQCGKENAFLGNLNTANFWDKYISPVCVPKDCVSGDYSCSWDNENKTIIKEKNLNLTNRFNNSWVLQ